MKKEKLRKEFFRLKFKGHSYNQCKKILQAKYGYEVTIRTLQRWMNRLNTNEWDLMDKISSKHFKNIIYLIKQ